MFKKIITKTNLDVSAMIRHGSIAVFTMFLIFKFFGINNIMLAFPLALTSLSMSKQNIHVRTLSKTFILISMNSLIIILAFISSYNPILGIFIDFLTIFFIGYFFTVAYNPIMYKPFLMLFVFSAYKKGTIEDLFYSLCAIVLGILVVIISERLIYKRDSASILKDIISRSLNLMILQIDNILENKFDENTFIMHSKEMRDLCYKIYITRYRKTLTTNIGKIKFQIYLSMEKLNICTRKLHYNVPQENYDEFFKNFLMCFKDQLKNISLYSGGFVSLENLNSNMCFFVTSYKDVSLNPDLTPDIKEYIENLILITKSLNDSINELSKLAKRSTNKIYKEWERSDIERFKYTLINNFKIGSIRLNFALRLAITLTISLYFVKTIDVYKVIWVSITIMSIMQPYYEDTLTRSFDRLKGNFLGILLLIILLNVINQRFIHLTVLIISLYLAYGFKDYSKLSLFTSLASLSVASLTSNITGVAIYRVVLILIGVIITIVSNRYLFPYKLEDGVKALMSKTLLYDKLILDELFENGYSNRVRDIIILSTLTSEKLNLRNITIKNTDISMILEENNEFLINLAYQNEF